MKHKKAKRHKLGGKPVPRAKDLHSYCDALGRYISHVGASVYTKDRYLCSFRVQRLLRRYHILGTTCEQFWRHHGECVLLGLNRP